MKKILQITTFFIAICTCLLMTISCNKTNKYTITYQTNGGSKIEAQVIEEGKHILIPSAPTKEGYTFVGWYEDEGLTKFLDYSMKVTSDVTIYAKWEENEISVIIHYDLGGGENNNLNPHTVSSKDDSKYLYPATKVGYEFTHWTLNGETVTEIPANLKEEITLVANYELVEYTITYVLNGSTNHEDNVVTYTINDLPLTLNEPTFLGKHFEGWYLNNNKVASITTSLIGNITLTANFEEIYKITYHGVGADLVDNPKSYYTSYGSFELEVPTLEGYVFYGWLFNGITVTSIPANTSGDITLISVYTFIEYNITYELDGGINHQNNVDKYTRENTYFPLKEPTKEGYVFTGWYMDGKLITSFETSLCKDVIVTATWEVAPIYHNIYYMLNGGKVPSGTQTYYQEGVELTLPTPTRDGYTFIGWNTLADGNGEYVTKLSVTEQGEKTFYAIWEKIIVISAITYELDGGVLPQDAIYSYEEGVSYTLPNPTKEYFNFLGWYFSEDFSGDRVFVISENATGDITVYAKWESTIEAYTITYNLNGGEFSKELPYQTRDEMVEDFIKDINSYFNVNVSIDTFFDASYNFSSTLSAFFNSQAFRDKWGWMKQYLIDLADTTGYSNALVLKDESATYHNNVMRSNVYAFIKGIHRTDWPASMDFSLVANKDGYLSYLPGETIDIIYEYYKLDTDYVLPSVIRSEYTFLGWYDESDNLVTVIEAGTEKDIVLNAKFESIYEIYTITYNLNGGEFTGSAMTQFIEKDEIILPVPVKPGYTFYAWFESEDFSTGEVFNIPVGTKRNIELYAYYTINTYSIKYDVETTNPTKYTVETPTITLEPAEKDGYEFLGWYLDNGVKVEQITKGSTGHINLTAKYRVIVDDDIKYTVTFVDQNGQVMSQQEVSHGRTASEILLGTYNDLQLSWYLEGFPYDFETLVTSDITLNAYWSIIDEIYNMVFTTPVITDDVQIYNSYETSMGTVTMSWKTSDASVLNTLTGVINPEYEDVDIKVTGTFKINGQAMTLVRYITVGKVNFKDLSNIQPVFGYFYSRMASAVVDEVAGETLDVINYGFARVTSDGLVAVSELKYIEKITALRKRGIRVLLCIGGYGTACREFSDAAFTQEGREKLANSILEMVEEYHFDGVDIDWEYPGYETGRDVSIDRPNYTLLMKEINDTLKAANPEYLVTAAIPGGKYGYARYELNKLDDILDYCHLMTYDLQSSSSASHHTGLFSGNGTPHGSVKQTVDLFVQQGMSKKKLVVGIAFYGRRFNTKSHLPGSASSITTAPSITYTNIYNNYLVPIKNGSTTIKRYWDDVCKAPYIYDSSTGVWISYDDPESISLKCQYVKDYMLGGVMFWDYGEDETYQLIYAIHDSMKK